MTPTVCAYKHASARHACCTHTMHAHTETQDSRQLAVCLQMHRPVHNLSFRTLKRLRQKGCKSKYYVSNRLSSRPICAN